MDVLIASLLLIAALWVVIVGILYLSGRRELAIEIAHFLPNLALLFKGLLADPRVPQRSKLLLVLGAAWIASPIDLIPEFLPVVGPLDDALVAALVLRYVVRAAGRDVVLEHWRGDRAVIDRLLELARV